MPDAQKIGTRLLYFTEEQATDKPLVRINASTRLPDPSNTLAPLVYFSNLPGSKD
jgi:hypothetical protein